MAVLGAVPVLLIAGGAGVVAVAVVIGALLIVFVCCRGRRIFSPHSSAPAGISASPDEAGDLTRPLFPDYEAYLSHQNQSTVGESIIQIEGKAYSPAVHVNNGNIHLEESQGDSYTVHKANDTLEESQLSQTLKRIPVTCLPAPDGNVIRIQTSDDIKSVVGSDANGSAIPYGSSTPLRSSLALEVIDGPAQGQSCSRQSNNVSKLPLTLGRVPPSDLVLRDSEVSGKHARINWNSNSLKWELVDMGSLNGTFLNSQAVHHPDMGSRSWSQPAELSDGDIITLGSSSKVSVQIMHHKQQQVPPGVGIASDPMIVRGKNLPMEDMSVCQYPLQGVEQFGLIGIFDGHGGAGAAHSASRLLPENVAKLLSDKEMKDKTLSSSDASDVLKHAFSLTEAAMDDHEYEGCTATVMLIWWDQSQQCFVQCANVGDSACVININGRLIDMTEDHRVVSPSERARISGSVPLREGETRLHGLNICRMLGDKFLKEQDARFIAEPYVSEVVGITKECSAFALMASDGLWDVISGRKAMQIALQNKNSEECSAEKVARLVLDEAKSLRTKDNTSVIFVDFDTLRLELSV